MALGACGLNAEGTLNTNNADDAGSNTEPTDAADVTSPGDDTDASDASDAADTPDANPYNTRVTDGLVALYDFEEGAESAETTVHDREDQPIDLTIADTSKVTWLDHALRIDDFTIIQSNGTADKIVTTCQGSNEVSVEAWVAPAMKIDPLGYGRIVNMSKSNSTATSDWNFTLGTTSVAWLWGLNAGELPIQGTVTTNLTHLVATRTSDGMSQFYVNASVAGVPNYGVAGLSGWKKYPLAIGNAPGGGGRGWQGEIHLIAIYCRALSQDEIDQNFAAGADP
ncbi:MAG: LamG domain-containing protein [Polyangiaceae bacterium]|nr:LamG domain-containing protein [Polyangiaceae bacterium]